MRAMIAVGVVLYLIVVSPSTTAGSKADLATAAKASPKRAAPRDGWPETRPGEVGRAWVLAFSTGEAAMREFYLKELSRESLAKRSADARLKTYRTFRERFGTLMFASVVKSTPVELTVVLMDSEAKPHTYIFKVEAAPPRRLDSVSMLETRPGGHFHH